ncbi:hypothetical protein [Paraburkholderia sp. J11-2]|uniref:hypothetical protein n=1 Tax=Paraburkholderia sp. J11-2 TaxID=2805431 RepID=UPI002AB6B07F|nr:hypothetical protein [Paraburkholderia sp. J11-2]
MGELARLAETAPSSVPAFLRAALEAFTDEPGWLASAARRTSVMPSFVECAARHCAGLPSKTDRREFRDRIAGYLSADELREFTDAHAAEWSRLRGLSPPG